MRRFALVAAAVLTTVAVSAPAAATTVSSHASAARTVSVARIALDGSSVCVASVNSRQCGAYQEALLRAVETRASATSRAISVNDIGTRQLDALIASVN